MRESMKFKEVLVDEGNLAALFVDIDPINNTTVFLIPQPKEKVEKNALACKTDLLVIFKT
jgi:hypothetical protein